MRFSARRRRLLTKMVVLGGRGLLWGPYCSKGSFPRGSGAPLEAHNAPATQSIDKFFLIGRVGGFKRLLPSGKPARKTIEFLRDISGWVAARGPPSKLSFAQSGIFNLSFSYGPHKCHEMTPELVHGADLGGVLHHFSSPTR